MLPKYTFTILISRDVKKIIMDLFFRNAWHFGIDYIINSNLLSQQIYKIQKIIFFVFLKNINIKHKQIFVFVFIIYCF